MFSSIFLFRRSMDSSRLLILSPGIRLQLTAGRAKPIWRIFSVRVSLIDLAAIRQT